MKADWVTMPKLSSNLKDKVGQQAETWELTECWFHKLSSTEVLQKESWEASWEMSSTEAETWKLTQCLILKLSSYWRLLRKLSSTALSCRTWQLWAASWEMRAHWVATWEMNSTEAEKWELTDSWNYAALKLWNEVGQQAEIWELTECWFLN